jgi:hypothetical protein
MQFGSSARFHTLSSAIRCNPWPAVLVLPLLLALAGCGGAMAPPQTQTPTLQPAGTGSTGSSGPGSDGSSTPAPAPAPAPPPPPPSGPPGVPTGATVNAALQTLPDWDWCTAELNGHPCASGLGDATSSMTENQGDPSLSGKAAEFKLGGPTRYSNALWWKQLGPNSTPTHFVYDLYFYMQDPSAPEALEFDINQSMNGVRYTWGTECSYRDTGYWDIWNPETGAWETTSVPCPVVAANQWHHLTWTVERVNGQAHYISVELDGDVHTVDKYYNPQRNYNGDGVNVAFQLDGDYRQDPYSVWLDNVSLSFW